MALSFPRRLTKKQTEELCHTTMRIASITFSEQETSGLALLENSGTCKCKLRKASAAPPNDLEYQSLSCLQSSESIRHLSCGEYGILS